MKGDEELIDIDLEEVKRAEARQKNPYLKKYNSKLKELLQSEISSKDNFINWITGLSGGALLFVFAQNKEMVDAKKFVVLAGIALFSALISAILFKMFIRMNYGPLRLEVKLLRILWERHEFRRNETEEKDKEGKVCKKTEENLRRNQKEIIKVLDPKHKEKTVWWSTIGYTLLNLFYWLTLGLFVLGFICMGVVYFA